MTSRNEIRAALEAVLFVSSEPVPRERLLSLFAERERVVAEEILAELCAEYTRDPEDDDPRSGIQADEVAGGVRLVTRPELNSYLRRYYEVTGRTRLSMAAIETLAIVAYRQPVTGPEIQELRGKSSGGVLNTLLEKRLIRITGRREVVGKPFEYATTRDFLMHFGLKSLKDLPPLEEFEEALMADAEAAEILEPEPLEPAPPEPEIASHRAEEDEPARASGEQDEALVGAAAQAAVDDG